MKRGVTGVASNSEGACSNGTSGNSSSNVDSQISHNPKGEAKSTDGLSLEEALADAIKEESGSDNEQNSSETQEIDESDYVTFGEDEISLSKQASGECQAKQCKAEARDEPHKAKISSRRTSEERKYEVLGKGASIEDQCLHNLGKDNIRTMAGPTFSSKMSSTDGLREDIQRWLKTFEILDDSNLVKSIETLYDIRKKYGGRISEDEWRCEVLYLREVQKIITMAAKNMTLNRRLSTKEPQENSMKVALNTHEALTEILSPVDEIPTRNFPNMAEVKKHLEQSTDTAEPMFLEQIRNLPQVLLEILKQTEEKDDLASLQKRLEATIQSHNHKLKKSQEATMDSQDPKHAHEYFLVVGVLHHFGFSVPELFFKYDLSNDDFELICKRLTVCFRTFETLSNSSQRLAFILNLTLSSYHEKQSLTEYIKENMAGEVSEPLLDRCREGGIQNLPKELLCDLPFIKRHFQRQLQFLTSPKSVHTATHDAPPQENKCHRGQMAAKSILKDVDSFNNETSENARFKILPWQSELDLRREVASLDKELRKQSKSKEHSTMGDQAQDIKEKKWELQLKQLQTPLSDTFKYFLQCLVDLSPTDRKYFLQSLKLGLSQHAEVNLQPLHDEYEKLQTEETSESKNERLQEIDKQLSIGSLGLEHFFREMAILHENLTVILKKVPGKVTQKILDTLAEAMAQTLMEGTSMEIMDGDAAYVPVHWLKAIFSKLKKNTSFFKVSVLGAQNCGKSTLLNTMFGLNFPVRRGRLRDSTKGA